MKENEYHQIRGGGIISGVRLERERITQLLNRVIDEKIDAQYGVDVDVDTKLDLAQDIVLVRRIIALINGDKERVEK